MTTAQALLLIVGVVLILASYVGAPTQPAGIALCFLALGLNLIMSLG